jgi:hypothetical protein
MIRLTEPNVRRLNAKLTAIVKRAHGYGLKAATIAHAHGELPVQRQMPGQMTCQMPGLLPGEVPRLISLPDGVTGTVSVADEPAKLREFVVQLSDLLESDTTVEIDGTAVAFERQPVGS